MFIVVSITNDGIDQVFGYTSDENVAKSKVTDLYKTETSEYHDYIYKEINELK